MPDQLRPDHLALWHKVQEDAKTARERVQWLGTVLLGQYGLTEGTLTADGAILRPGETLPTPREVIEQRLVELTNEAAK